MRIKKYTLFKIWAEISLAFFVLQSTVIAKCDSLYVEIEENCYWEQDIQFLKDLISNSDLTIEPLDLGTQTWTNGRITYFYTVNSDLKGEIPVSVGNLNELTYFYSYGNKFTGSIPDTMGHLTNLTSLGLEYSEITGTIPESLSNLTSLTNLSLIGNQLSGTIPETISNLTNLTQLNLSWNDFSGEIPSKIGTLSNLTSLDLSGNDLSGSIPTEIGNLSMIENLWLGDNDLTGDIPSGIGNMANLKHLRLTNNNFSGDIPSWVFNITNLEVLELNGNAFTGSIPSDIGNLNNLKVLELANNQLTGSIPAEIGSMTNLKWSVSLSNNQLSGSIPPEIGNLKNLERLYLSNNQLSGEIPTEMGNLDSLKALWLNDNQLRGTVPESICNLNLAWGYVNNWDISTIYGNQLCPVYPDTLYPACVADYMGTQGGCSYAQIDGKLYLENDLKFLKDLIANSNLSTAPLDLGLQQWSDGRLTYLALTNNSQRLKGGIPLSVGNLTQLTVLNSNKNKFTGSIPDTIKHLVNLTHLSIKSSDLEGEIPVIIGDLKKLEELNLYNNNFTGSIPNTMTSLTNLTTLNLGLNALSGTIPSTIGELINLEYLGLNSNQLSGTVPEALGNLTILKYLYLNSNKLSGSIPKTIGNLTNLQYLGLYSNQLSGTIPEATGNLSKLDQFYLHNNKLTGAIPATIANLTNLTFLYLNNNKLSGSIPETIGNLTSLKYLYLYNNKLSGAIPETVGNITKLDRLALDNNELTGLIPNSIGNLSNLTFLNFSNNKLDGTIPDSIGNLSSLRYLYLYNNQLTGSIPEAIGNLSNLRSLNLYSNELIGSIPETIGNLSSLVYLYLYDNKLTGEIPRTIGNLTNLKYFYLYDNKLSGSIPGEIGSLTKLTNLALDYNELTGSIPNSIGNLTNLWFLNFGNNKLDGAIPDSIGNLSRLQYLYLYGNQLTGEIPEVIGNLTNLKYLSLYENQLTGKIPKTVENLTKLASLKFSKNQLRGIVPVSLCNLPYLQTIELSDNNLCPSYPECLDASSIGNQDISKCHYSDIYELMPTEPAPGQMIALNGINFGSPLNATKVNFYQNETVAEGFLFKSPSSQTELFVRIPSGLAIGSCTTRVAVLGDSLMTSLPLTFTLNSIPDAPILGRIAGDTYYSRQLMDGKVYKKFGSDWSEVSSITAEDTILVPGYGIDTEGWTVFLSKDGKTLQGNKIGTQSDSVLGIAPQFIVPTGLGTGKVNITISVVVGGIESNPSDNLEVNYMDNFVFVNNANIAGPWLGTEESPFNEIQKGINAVSKSGTVLVSDGTYVENINFNGKGIKLGSLFMTTGDTAHISSTIIDGNNSGSVVSFVNNEDTSSVLTGFTIQNGSGTLINETQTHGGGIYCNGASPTLKHLNIINNSATHWGGGINCSFTSHPIISHVVIRGNKTLDQTDGQGGGLYCWFSAPQLANILMVNNSAVYGGGAYLGQAGSGAKFTNVTIADNTGTYGGGFYLSLENGQLTNTPTVLNSIIWNNKPQQIYFTEENNPWAIDISYSIIEGGQDSIRNENNATINWGEGNTTSSPFLTIDYRLDPYSPAIGAGLSTGAPSTDLDGDPRPNPEGSSPDLGAYESIRALRLLRTAPILDGLDPKDKVLWNDSTSLSAHWKKFEDNPSVTYEFAIGTFDKNNIIDWQSAGLDTSVTVSGLNLKHDSTYFFHVRGVDDLGRESKISSSNGVLIDIVPPEIVIEYPLPKSISNMTAMTYSLSEDLHQGEFKWIWLGGVEDTLAPYTAELTLEERMGGEHSQIELANNPTVVENALYTMSFSGRDHAGNKTKRAFISGLQYDFTPPKLTWQSPLAGDAVNLKDIHFENSELLDSGTITWSWVGSVADPDSIHAMALTGDELNGAEFGPAAIANSPPLVDGAEYNISYSGFDPAGNESNHIIIQNVLYDITQPAVISVAEEWTAVNPVLGDLAVQLDLSEPVVSGAINLSSAQDDQYQLEYNLVEQKKYDITISGPFTGGDELFIKVTGLQDRAGTIARDTTFTYPVGYLSDYNLDGLVDVLDLSKLVTGWQNKDIQYELGPTSGNAPFLKPDVDGQFDIYDAAAFTRMWHWSLNKSGKMVPRYYVNSGKNLTSKNKNKTLMITVSEDVSTMYIFFEYPKEKVRLQQLPQASSGKEIVLSDLDTLNGEFLITAGYLEPKLKSFDVPYIIMGKDDVMIKATYLMFDTSGEIFSQGTKEITLRPVPEEFALHQNYPNPFNPITTINYDLPQQTHVNLMIYDILGREVVKLISEEIPAGYQSVIWNTRNNFGQPVSAGVYFYQIQTKDFVKTKKMVLLK